MGTVRNVCVQHDATATGYIPFELMYGHQAELMALTKSFKPTYTYNDYAQELKIAIERVKGEKAKAKQQYDKTGEIKFKVGDKVLVYDETLRRQ